MTKIPTIPVRCEHCDRYCDGQCAVAKAESIRRIALLAS